MCLGPCRDMHLQEWLCQLYQQQLAYHAWCSCCTSRSKLVLQFDAPPDDAAQRRASCFSRRGCSVHWTLLQQSIRLCLQVDAIVFLVDAADPERFPEAKKELDALLSEDHLSKARSYNRGLFCFGGFFAFWLCALLKTGHAPHLCHSCAAAPPAATKSANTCASWLGT